MSEICEMQFTQKEYLPVSIDKTILKSLKYDEVGAFKYNVNFINKIGLFC